MVNPLEQFVPVEERPDGVYVKAGKADKDLLRIGIINSAIENSYVMNFDISKFQDVITRGRGVFERIGPLFEFYNPDVEKFLQVTITAQKAFLKINSGYLSMGKKPSEKVIVYFLKRKGVVHGLKSDQIKEIVNENRYDESYEIAEATPPIDGQDAKIEFKIPLDSSKQPQLRSDGSVDYRDIKSFTSVAKGEIIAVKCPPTAGKPGFSLNGEQIPAKPGLDHQFPNGKNTEISPDGKQLSASKAGIICKEGLHIHVIEILNINGDIDFNVGNVKFSGDVLIAGDIHPGFTVEADGNVHIKGDVESAKVISRNGKVIVEKGILGKGDTLINGKLGITVSFAQEAMLVTEGTISFEKFLLHCDCVCQTMEGHGPDSSIMGGEVKAEKSVTVKNIGTEKGAQTKVVLFDKQKAAIEEKIKELGILEKKLRTELEPIEKQLQTKAALLRKADEITARHREEVKKWVDAYNLLNQKVKYVVQKTEELKNGLKGPKMYTGFVHVQSTIYAGTELDLYEIKHCITERLTNKRFRILNSGIQSEG